LSTTRPKSRSLGKQQRFTATPTPFLLLRTCQNTDKKPDSPLSAKSSQWNCECFIEVDVEMDKDISEMRRCGIARRAQMHKISA